MTPLFAHVAGVPVEEMLAAGPALLAGGGLVVLRARMRLRALRTARRVSSRR